jgi:hypothetical protein
MTHGNTLRSAALVIAGIGVACGGSEFDESDYETDENGLFFGDIIIRTMPLELCHHADGSGGCKVFYGADLDLSDDTYCSGCSSVNDTSSLLRLDANYDALLCEHANFGGGCRFFLGAANENLASWSYTNGVPMNDRTSSVELYRKEWATFWSSFTYLSNYPHDREHSWASEAQGMAHDASNWFITNRWNIYKYPVSADLSNTNAWTLRAGLPDSCAHFGDADFYSGELFAPLEGCPTTANRIYVYDANLNRVRKGILPQAEAPWVAINPTNGLLYSSDFNSDHINVYARSFSDGANMTLLYTIQLDRTYPRIQGGTFSDSGHFYLVSDDEDCPERAGIYVFRIRGRNATRMNYIHPNGYAPGDGEELEGITLWNLDNVSGKHASVAGHIHWLLLDNDVWSNDDVYGKHITVDNPSAL